jgi:hypothetical protein
VTNEPDIARLFRLSSVLVGGVLIIMLISWISGDPVERVSTDWTAFDRAADRLFGDDAVYRSYDEESLPYLYPPFALWLTLPLRFLGFWGSFALSVVATLASSVLAYRLVMRHVPDNPSNRAVMTGAVFSGTTISAALIGQYSGLWALSLVGALVLWERGREELAGATLAVLLIKPNLGLAVPVVLVWSRSWRVLRGMSLASMGLLVLSIPFGLSRWEGFIRNLQSTADVQIRDVAFVDKMITVQTSFQSLSGLGSRSPIVVAVFGLAALLTGVSVLVLWSPKALAESRLRAVGGLALFLVAANPRLYFYDGVLMVVGVLAWWGSRGLWISERRLRQASVAAAGLWIGSWGGIFLGLNVVVGPLAAVLLMLWALDTRAMRADTDTATSPAGDVVEPGPLEPAI